MITIDQLLESVDLDFEPRFITKDGDGVVEIWNERPFISDERWWGCEQLSMCCATYDQLKLSEFDGKDWTECMYEVPRKTTGKIEPLTSDGGSRPDHYDFMHKINELVDAVNRHSNIIQQIGEWGTSKGEFLWCETLTKFEPTELKETKNE